MRVCRHQYGTSRRRTNAPLGLVCLTNAPRFVRDAQAGAAGLTDTDVHAVDASSKCERGGDADRTDRDDFAGIGEFGFQEVTTSVSISGRTTVSLVAARWTALARSVVALGAAPDPRDLLHQESEFFMEFEDALPMALDLLEQGRQFRAVAERHQAKRSKVG